MSQERIATEAERERARQEELRRQDADRDRGGEQDRGRARDRDRPPHFDPAAAAADPAFMDAMLRGLLANLAVPQVQAPAPPPAPPAPRVYVPLIPLVSNRSAFHTDHWKKEANFLALGRHNWDTWNDNLVRSLGLVSPLDRWIEHDRARAGAYWPRPVLGANSTYEDERNADHWDRNDESARMLILAVITTDEARAVSSSATAKALYKALVDRHRESNALTIFSQWQKAFSVTVDGETAEQWEDAPNTIARALDRIFAVAPPTRDSLEVMLLLHALSGDAEYVQRGLIADIANGTLTADAILRRYRAEAERLRQKGQTGAVLAAMTSSDPRCGRCAGYGHRRAKCPSAESWESANEVRAILARPSGDVVAAVSRKSHDAKRSPTGPFNALLPSNDGRPRDGASSRGRGSTRGGRGGGNSGRQGGRGYVVVGGVPHGLVDGYLYPVGVTTTPPDSATASGVEEELTPDADTDSAWMYTADVMADDPGAAADLAAAAHLESCAPSPPAAARIVEEAECTNWRDRDQEEQVYQLSSNPDLVARRGLPAWVLDSGATMHCTPELADLSNTRSIAPISVRGIGGKIVRATKVGDMEHTLADGRALAIRGVLYIPGVDIRLVSLGKLADAGLDTRLSASAAHLVRASDGAVLATGTRVGNGLYTLDVAVPATALAMQPMLAAVPDDVWHARLGHPAHDHVRRLAQSGAVRGMHLDLSYHPAVCQPCIRGKQKVSAMPKRRVGEKSGALLDLVFCDLSGSAERVATPNGEHYSMSMLDDHTSFVWTKLLKTKDQAADEIIAWHARVSRQHGRTLRTLQIDNGELKSKKLESWSASLGIEIRFTAPYSSSQNGRVERVHQTIAGTARAMRIACGLPENMWGEFTLTASYLRNFRLTTALPANVTPHESRFRIKPDLSHLREIGCKAFVLIQNVHVTKIQPRSLECILIGYDLHSKAYRCYHRPSRRIIVSRNVYFVESHQLTPRLFRPGQSVESPTDTPNGEHPDGWPSAPIVQPPAPTSVEPLAMPRGAELEPDVTPSSDDPTARTARSPSDLRKRAAYREKRKTRSRSPPATPAPERPAAPRTRVECVDVPEEELEEEQALPRRSERARHAPAEPGASSERHRQVLEDVRAGAERVRQRKARGAPAVVDAYAAIERDPALPIETVFGLIGETELGDVSLDEVFGEWLEDDLVAFTAALEVLDDEDTLTLKQALSGPERDKWRHALLEEFESIRKMGTFRLVPRSSVPTARRILRGKAVFKRKRNEVGDIVRYKARWVVKGFLQVFGQDYNKTTSPTARLESVRILCHIAAALDLEMRQFDVKCAFLHGNLPDDEHIFMEQPPGFEDPHKPDHVWELLKGLYGMKQAGRLWNAELNGAMEDDFAYHRVSVDHCLYVKRTDEDYAAAAVHVDDTLAIGTSVAVLDKLEADLRSKWEISVGDASFILGIHIERDRPNRLIHLSQTALIDKLAAKHGQVNCRTASTPMEHGAVVTLRDSPVTQADKDAMADKPYRELLGGLQYLAHGSRPDICYAVGRLASVAHNPGVTHWNMLVRVLRYLVTTRGFRLTLGGTGPINLSGMTDSDYANCVDTRRSVSGYAFTLGRGAVSWSSRKQDIVTTSTTEAEYVALANATKETLWLRALVAELGFKQGRPSLLMADNQGAIVLSEDQSNHARTKHIDVRYHFVRERTANGDILVKYVRSCDNVADIFTKPLPPASFTLLRRRLGVSAAM
jgi:hypothetical protein